MKENYPLVSIALPIYNQEKFLGKSLSSLQAQTYRNLEIILVDDGSTDDSAIICRHFCDSDARFRYFYKSNGGLASARQFAIDKIHGEYTVNMDPDDWAEPEYIEKLLTKALKTGADMVVCDYYEEYLTDCNIKRNHVASDSPLALKIGICNGTLWGVHYNKIIRTSCYKNKVNFEPGINIHEDKLFVCRVLNYCNRIEYIPDILYHYNRANTGSLLHNMNYQSLLNMWKVRELIVNSATNDNEREMLKSIQVRDWGMLKCWFHPEMTNRKYRELMRPYRKYIWRWKDTPLMLRVIYFFSTVDPTSFTKSLYRKLFNPQVAL